jgi:hypothetical protein
MDSRLKVRGVVGESPWGRKQIQVAQEKICVAREHQQVSRGNKQLARVYGKLSRAPAERSCAHKRLAYEYERRDLWAQVRGVVKTYGRVVKNLVCDLWLKHIG